MRMSHIYQPVMIKHLLMAGGGAADIDIAGQLLQYDPSQVEYYQNVTNNMVGQVLRKHGIVERKSSNYELVDYSRLSQEQIHELILLCESKIEEYIKKRGDAIWNHRRNSRQPISGTIRYEVFKRAGFRCELCGISAAIKALEVDHIVPKNTGGEDSINNYQALCYSCNASKRDRDNTDFRNRDVEYSAKDEHCIFCNIKSPRRLYENNLAFVIKDGFPVTPSHTLIIPKRHFSDYFDSSQAEINSLNQLILLTKKLLYQQDKSIEGFNVGINCGETAGQTIMHTHVHLIPRRKNDVVNPRGGIRNVIPGKGNY